MAQETKIEVVLRNGRFYRRNTEEQDLGSQDQIIAGMSEGAAYPLPHFMPFGGQMLHLIVSKTRLVVLTELPSLPFRCYWEPSTPTHMVPRYSDGNTGCLLINDPWVVPRGVKCLFGLVYASGLIGHTWTPQTCYLFFCIDGELYSPPYPNIYEDGRICMGPEWERKKTLGKDIISDFVHAHSTFMSTNMSSHLVRNQTPRIFKRTYKAWDYPSVEDIKANSALGAPAFMAGLKL